LTSRTPARARVFDDLTERGVLCDGDVALSLIWVAAAGTGRPLTVLHAFLYQVAGDAAPERV
jgi:hypothetical protein